MRKIIYFNKTNLELLDRLDESKLDDFSGYVCDLIRKDLKNEEMKAMASDLEEIKQKIDMLQKTITNNLVSTSDKESDMLDVDKLLWK